ncbi:hypothetical protein Cfor_10341 [Coptotermes formosanus]|uniref:Uncharacterized protein n=1 Tax=Coptotermes formosanus TaxID=36987 RepID=A0A6L2PK84_COPFO|nr:hypothetical protein Cfor_10341 [Coptotermes formosanus]
MKELKEKLRLIPADKGKMMIIIDKNMLDDKVHQFLTDNQFSRLYTNATDKYQKQVKQILQRCNSIICKQVKHLIQKQPTPPTLQARLKLHKPIIPIRPDVNNIDMPTYKIAKHMSKLLEDCLDS